MNPVLRFGAESAQLGWLLGITTAGFMGLFIVAVAWCFGPDRSVHEKAALLPLDDY